MSDAGIGHFQTDCVCVDVSVLPDHVYQPLNRAELLTNMIIILTVRANSVTNDFYAMVTAQIAIKSHLQIL